MTAWSASVTVSAGGFDLALSIEGDDTPVALIGPNGSGKTTALRAIAGAVAVSDARVEIGNRVLDCTEREIQVPMQDRGIGYVPQGYGLFPHLTVMENVEFGLTVGARRDRATSRTERVGAMLSRLGCESLAHRRVDRLSGGEQQRVALARALVMEPDMLLLDEPLAALDATRRRAVRLFLAEQLSAFGRPCILVTHDVRDVLALGATVVVLEEGAVSQTGSLEALRTSPASDFVREFVATD
jgi:molybdate transport system ATP-binding protein